MSVTTTPPGSKSAILKHSEGSTPRLISTVEKVMCRIVQSGPKHLKLGRESDHEIWDSAHRLREVRQRTRSAGCTDADPLDQVCDLDGTPAGL